jgi:stage III sporulation protein AE
MSYDLGILSDLDILPELRELDRFLEELLPGESKTSLDFVEDVLQGNWVLEPGVFWRYVSDIITSVIYNWKQLFISVLVLFILSAVVGSVLEAFNNSGAAKAAKLFFIVCQLAVLINAFKDVLEIVEGALSQMLDFLKLIIPAYMICMAASGSGMTALIFYKLILGFVCLVEALVASSLISVAEGYVMLGVAESIWGEERFKPLMDLIRKSMQWGLKSMIIILSGSSILQIIITPAIDKVNNVVIHKTAGAIPGIGDIVESVSSVTIASAIALKNSIGVLILVILILIIVTPVIHSLIIILTVRVAGALGSICGERRMSDCVEYISEAGFMLIRILITVATLFFITIAAVTNATSGGI